MKLKKILEKTVSPIRLGWHGILISGLSAIAICFLDDSFARVLSISPFAFGITCYLNSIDAFMRTRKDIKKKKTLDRRFVEPHLYKYCNRQGARTAAANYGLADKFDEIMNNYKGRMDLINISHV